MNSLEKHMRYIDWLQEYELFDPEPPLDTWVIDKFDHIDSKGRFRGDGRHWRTDLVNLHMDWHRRLTNAYSKVKGNIE